VTSSRADARNAASVPERRHREPIEWGIATRCRLGETTTGDLGVVHLLPGGALVAGIDGLGHGREAARAARRAAAVMRGSPGDDLVGLVQRCHTALRGTRGAAISVAFVSASDSRMTWLGVGNVEGRVLSGDRATPRAKESLALGRGVLGHELPAVQAATIPVQPGDVLLLATDGVHAGFADSLELSGSSQAISERIVADHWKRSDDALVIVVRYLGMRW
jgi:negative regulator of sigma-B (phosphoserine phosphatase)